MTCKDLQLLEWLTVVRGQISLSNITCSYLGEDPFHRTRMHDPIKTWPSVPSQRLIQNAIHFFKKLQPISVLRFI